MASVGYTSFIIIIIAVTSSPARTLTLLQLKTSERGPAAVNLWPTERWCRCEPLCSFHHHVQARAANWTPPQQQQIRCFHREGREEDEEEPNPRTRREQGGAHVVWCANRKGSEHETAKPTMCAGHDDAALPACIDPLCSARSNVI